MRRFPSMKIGLASILSCLALMLGMFATTGTASAHSQTPLHRPIINASDVQEFGNCVSFELLGIGFSGGHHADLEAQGRDGEDVSIDPDRVRVHHDGTFDVEVQVCGNSQFSNCGDFIEGPSFCGFNFGTGQFCQFEPGFGPCFGNFPPPNPFCGQPGFPPCPPIFPPPGGFNPIPVGQFCQFNHFNFPFCFIHRHHRLSFLITATDDHSGRDSNSIFLSVGVNGF